MSMTRRAMLAAGAVVTVPAALGQQTGFDASVGADAPGARRYASVGEAAAAAPSDRPFRILVGEGVHREKLVIERANVHLVGAGPGTVLSYDAAAGMARPDRQAWGTWGCASVIVRAPDFSAAILPSRTRPTTSPISSRRSSSGSVQTALKRLR